MPIILNINASVRFSSWQCQWPYPPVFNLILFQSILWRADKIISGWKHFKVLLQWVCSHSRLHPHLALLPSSAPTMLRTIVPSIVFVPSLLLYLLPHLPAMDSYTWFMPTALRIGSGSLLSRTPPSQLVYGVLLSSVQFSRSVVSDSLRPYESQHARPPCPSLTPRV